MKIQKERLNRAIELIDKDLKLRGGGTQFSIKKEEWSGDRYAFLLDLDKLFGDRYDFTSNDDFILVEVRGENDEDTVQKVICLYDTYF